MEENHRVYYTHHVHDLAQHDHHDHEDDRNAAADGNANDLGSGQQAVQRVLADVGVSYTEVTVFTINALNLRNASVVRRNVIEQRLFVEHAFLLAHSVANVLIIMRSDNWFIQLMLIHISEFQVHRAIWDKVFRAQVVELEALDSAKVLRVANLTNLFSIIISTIKLASLCRVELLIEMFSLLLFEFFEGDGSNRVDCGITIVGSIRFLSVRSTVIEIAIVKIFNHITTDFSCVLILCIYRKLIIRSKSVVVFDLFQDIRILAGLSA